MLRSARRTRFLVPVALAVTLGACGGGDGDIGISAPPAGDTYALTSGGRLITFNRATPGTIATSAVITGLATGETLLGIDLRPSDGQLYGLTSNARVVILDPATAAATVVFTLSAHPTDTSNPFAGLDGTAFGIDFNPVPDALRIVSNTGQNLRVALRASTVGSTAVPAGATTTDTALTLDNMAATGISGAAYTNSFGAACRTTLFYLDTSANRLLTTTAPNDGILRVVGPLGLTASSAVSAFEVSTSSSGANTAFAAVTSGGAPVLVSIDTATGMATAIGPIAGAAGLMQSVIGLAMQAPSAAPQQAAGDTFGVTDTNRLVSFNRGAPNKFCTEAALAPLNAEEDVVGIDFRPSTGVLHGLGHDGANTRLLTIDPATGAVSNPVNLSVDLTGEHFGMDFNPTGPVALRIVGDDGQNLRVTDIASGATTADGSLNGQASTGVMAAAYTNSVAGAGSTTLYVIDATTDSLLIQNPPNAGTLARPASSAAGNLGFDVGEVTGFDIDGRDNLALLSATVGEGSSSNLYTLNLATGAATAVPGGAIGSGSGFTGAVRGLARRTPTTTVFGLRNGASSGQELVQLSLSDPTQVTPIGAVTVETPDTALVGIDLRPADGLLYGVGNGGGLYVLDPTTGAASARRSLSTAPDAAVAGFGVDFNPLPASVPLRIVGGTQNLRVSNVADGTTAVDATLSRAPATFTVQATAYTNSFPSPPSTVLYALDSSGDRLLAINRPNDGTVRVIGAVGTGLDVTADSMMDIAGTATALAVFDGAAKTLYNVDLATGAATSVGTIGAIGAVLAIAHPIVSDGNPVANSLMYAVDAAGPSLLSFARNAPGSVSARPITGIPTTETIRGMDFRASSGVLHVLTVDAANVAQLYTVDPASGAATSLATLTVDPNDGTAPYGTMGATRDIDFNPLPATVPLRIINPTQNLRVTNVSGAPVTPTGMTTVPAGGTFTDTVVGQPVPAVHAAAYANSFASPASTTLFVIDAASGSLLVQGGDPAVAGTGACPDSADNPNCGILTNRGALSAGLSFGAAGGFDIAAGANGLALATLVNGSANPAESASRLYRINLATGAATEVGSGGLIGGADANPITGLAIRLQ